MGVIALAGLALGCGRQERDVAQIEWRALVTPGSPDEWQAELAERQPGFGGVYQDPVAKVPVVRATPRADRAALRAAVGASLTRSPTTPSGAAHFDAETIVFADATYDFRELVAFHGRLAPLIARLQITQTDIDEVSNTVYIGVRTPEAVSAARAALLDLGVPSDAVHVAVAGPIVLTANVGDEVRPVPGGVMILDNAASPGACTVGFNVTRNEWWGTQYGFLTASHCTKFSGRTSDATDFSRIDAVGVTESGVTRLVTNCSIHHGHHVKIRKTGRPSCAALRMSHMYTMTVITRRPLTELRVSRMAAGTSRRSLRSQANTGPKRCSSIRSCTGSGMSLGATGGRSFAAV